MNEYSEFEVQENTEAPYIEEDQMANEAAEIPAAPVKKKKKRRKKHYFLRFLIFCAIVAGGIAFMLSDFFMVTKIEVEGNKYYTQAQVVEMSGLKTGYNIFKMSTKGCKELLLEDPYIKAVEIKKIPRSTIKLIITERTEYAAVPYGNEYVLIDDEGMVLRVTDTEPVLPLLGGMNIIAMNPGSPLDVEQSYLLTDTLDLLSDMEAHDLFFKRVEFSKVVVKAYIYDDLYCKGAPADIKKNMDEINSVLQDLYKQEITKGVIQVGNDNYLTYSPKID